MYQHPPRRVDRTCSAAWLPSYTNPSSLAEERGQRVLMANRAQHSGKRGARASHAADGGNTEACGGWLHQSPCMQSPRWSSGRWPDASPRRAAIPPSQGERVPWAPQEGQDGPRPRPEMQPEQGGPAPHHGKPEKAVTCTRCSYILFPSFSLFSRQKPLKINFF